MTRTGLEFAIDIKFDTLHQRWQPAQYHSTDARVQTTRSKDWREVLLGIRKSLVRRKESRRVVVLVQQFKYSLAQHCTDKNVSVKH